MEVAVKTDGNNAPVHQMSSDGFLGVTGWFSRSQSGREASKKPAVYQKDTIPLQDYRNDTLQKIHAHSSAETSGLGDSLQRIHTLSSTETSGYGDGALSPTHSPDFGRASSRAGSWNDHSHSPEVHGDRDKSNPREHNPTRYHRQDSGPNENHRGVQPDGKTHSPSTLGQRYYSVGYNPHKTAALPPERTKGGADNRADISSAPSGSYSSTPGGGEQQQQHPLAKRSVSASASVEGGGGHRWRVPGSVKSKDRAKFLEAARKARQTISVSEDTGEVDDSFASAANNGGSEGGVRNTGQTRFMTAMDTSSTTDGGSVGRVRPDLQHRHPAREHPARENPVREHPAREHPAREHPAREHRPHGRHSRSGSVKSITSNFLGVDSNSTWLKWSQERRNSFKKRLDTIEMKQAEVERNRVSTPVRKARKESVMFMSMSSKDYSYEDELEMQQIELNQQLTTYSVKTTTSKKDKEGKNQTVVEEVKLSMWQWNSLVAFWEHKVFIRSRYLGTILSIFALVLEVIAVVHSDWHTIPPSLFIGTTRAGLWYECVDLPSGTTNCTTINELPKGPRDWQNAVIGLLIFSLAFGSLATILSVCGICAVTLAKKIYYYHSAGEIYLICALSCTAAMIVYPIALAMEKKKLVTFSFGVGYHLGWGASFFFAAAAMCMCLDDLVRAFSKGRCACCQRSSSNKPSAAGNTHTTSGV